MDAEKKPIAIFILGGPGAGKGTQCTNVVNEFEGFAHISAGDCLRAERKNPDSANGALINDYIKNGQIVPVDITVNLMVSAMKASGKHMFLVDGFPRNLDNVEGWERVVGDTVDVKFCLYFDCTEAEMEARLIERGKTSGRADDNVASIKKRFATYVKETQPIIEMFEAKGKCRKINSSCSPEEVWASVKALFETEVIGKK